VAYECIPRADDTVPCVSAASILAKTTRDAQVLAQVDADPSLDDKYGLRKNKGYLAPRHIQGLKEHGFSSLHRTSYHIRGL
jgi:ribonuclease HII